MARRLQQDARHEDVEGEYDDDGYGEVDEEAEHGVQLRVEGAQLGRMYAAQMHDGTGELDALDVREDGVRQRENARENPYECSDAERALCERHLVDAHRVDDGTEAVSAKSGQREDGHAEGERLQELVQLTHGRAEAPLRERVDGRRERNRDQKQQKVSGGETHDVDIRSIAHALVAHHDVDQSAVADDTDHENDDEQHWHDVRLGPVDEQRQSPTGRWGRIVRRVTPLVTSSCIVVRTFHLGIARTYVSECSAAYRVTIAMVTVLFIHAEHGLTADVMVMEYGVLKDNYVFVSSASHFIIICRATSRTTRKHKQ